MSYPWVDASLNNIEVMIVMDITYWKRAFLSEVAGLASPTQLHDIIDLGIPFEMVARILRVDTWIVSGIEHVVNNDGYHAINGWVSIDPDVVQWFEDSDDFIVDYTLNTYQHGSVGDVSGAQRAISRSFDFSALKVITSRNVAFGARCRSDMGTKPESEWQVAIFYELFRPTANDLNQIIAARR